MRTVVIVPYRPDHGHRDRLWTFLRDNYWVHQPFDVLIGEDNSTQPFNRSKSINDAANNPWDTAIIADADTWVPARQLHRAILVANIRKTLVSAFDAVVELSKPGTDNILTGRTPLAGSFEATKVRTRSIETQSSMLVITRDLWEQVGGFDERFKGWAGEDNAFWHACTLIGGQPERIPGNAYHLWHSPAKGKGYGIDYKRNLNLWRRYEKCRTVEQLRDVQCSR